jgi:hypothetical protein
VRFITGQRQDDVRSAAREAGISPNEYKFVPMSEDSIRSLRGSTLEYVGMRPTARFMEVAATMNIQVVKFDQMGGSETLPDRTMVGDIEISRVPNPSTGREEFRARKGQLWIVIDPWLIEQARGDIEVLVLMLVPEFRHMEKKEAEHTARSAQSMGDMVRQKQAAAEAKWRAKYEAADYQIPDYTFDLERYKYDAKIPTKAEEAAKTAERMRKGDMFKAQAFLDIARQMGMPIPDFKTMGVDLAADEPATPAPPVDPDAPIPGPLEENEADIQEAHKRVTEAEKNKQITAEQAAAMREEVEKMRTNLILAADEAEAAEFAAFMGFNNWVFLDNYRRLMNYGGSIVYVVGGGRDREDFGAIEGLFIQKNITQVDMEV